MIWDWKGSSGKDVQFRRRFRSEFPPPEARLALRVRNESTSPERVMLKIYAQCN